MFKIEDAPRELSFGRRGEHGEQYEFDFSAWAAELPGGGPGVTVILPYTSDVVTLGAAQAVVDGTTLTVKVENNLTLTAGRGTMVIRYVVDGHEKRSRVIDFTVEESHAPSTGDAPEPVTDWVSDATAKLAEVDHFVDETIAATTAANAAATLASEKAAIAAQAATDADNAHIVSAEFVDDDLVFTTQGADEIILAGAATTLKGDTGNGIDSIALTLGDHAPGTTDTYTITFTDGNTTTFTVYNGQDYQQDFPLTWDEFRNHVRQGTIDNYFSVGDQFNVAKGATNLVFDLVDIGSSTRNTTANGNAPTDPTYFTQFPNAKPVTLLMHDVIWGVMFDNAEANYKINTQINSGATCVINLGSATVAAANYRFTASKNLVVGGKLRFIDATHFGYYSTSSATVESMLMAAGEEGDGFVSIAGSLSAQNNLDRVSYGSNKYTESAIRQWLNAGGAAGSFWTSKSNYDLAPSWHSTLAGFRNGLDADFLAAIGETTREVELNTVTDGGSVTPNTTLSDKIFLPSRMEIFNAAENAGHKGLQYQAYVGLADIDKIKYDSTALSTARNWWLRSPNAGVASYPRIVYQTTGALSIGGIYAYFGFGAAAACVIL